MEVFKIAESFVSINGEGKKAGRLSMFIRLRGCNLNCFYCDTKWAISKKGEADLMTASEVAQLVKESGVDLVTLTGGEPLLDENISGLIGSILSLPKTELEIETNGSIPIRPWRERDARFSMTMDYKLPSSGMEESMCLENMEELKPWDAKEVIERFSLCEKAIVYFSPVFGAIPPDEIVEFMKEHRMNKVRFQIQIHKVVWDPERKGV